MTFRQGKVIDHVAGRIHGKETLMCGIPSPTVKSRHVFICLAADRLFVRWSEGGRWRVGVSLYQSPAAQAFTKTIVSL